MVSIDAPAQAYRGDEGCEIVVNQDNRGGLAGDIRTAPAHGHADMSGLERRRIVHAVTCHRDDFAVRLERLDETQLVFRPCTRIDVHRAHTSLQLIVGHRLQFCAGQHARLDIEACLSRDRQRRARMIAGDHDDANAGLCAVRQRARDIGAQRIGQAHEPQ